MTATVKMFSYAELQSLPVSHGSARYSTDSVQVLGAYLASEAFTVETGSQSNSATGTAPVGSRLAKVEVQTGKTVAYEITAANGTLRTVSATTSPTIEGRNNIIPLGPSDRLSFLDVTA